MTLHTSFVFECDRCGKKEYWEPDGVNFMPKGWNYFYREDEDADEHYCDPCYKMHIDRTREQSRRVSD